MSQLTQAKFQTQPQATNSSLIKSDLLQRAAITPIHSPTLQRCSNGVECPECRQKRLEHKRTLQRTAVDSAPSNGVPPIVHDVLSSSGQPLDAGTRAFMEPRFGHDFSGVRVHTDARAAESARAVNALAYTVGRDVVFGTGQYAQGTSEGKRLLAHELTHVVQQASNTSSFRNIGSADDVSEREANSNASAVLNGQHSTARPTMSSLLLQRKPETGDTTRKTPSQKGSKKHKSGVRRSKTLRISPPPSLHIPIPPLHLDPLNKPDLSHLPPSTIERYQSKPPVVFPPGTQGGDQPVSTPKSKSANKGAQIQANAEIERDIRENKTNANLQLSLTWPETKLKSFLHGRLEALQGPALSMQSSFELANLPGLSAEFKSFAIQASASALNAHVLRMHGDDIIEVALTLAAGVEVGREGDVDLKGSAGVQSQLHVGKLKVFDFEVPDTDVSVYLSVNAEPTLHLRRAEGGKSTEGVLGFGGTVVVGIQISF